LPSNWPSNSADFLAYQQQQQAASGIQQQSTAIYVF